MIGLLAVVAFYFLSMIIFKCLLQWPKKRIGFNKMYRPNVSHLHRKGSTSPGVNATVGATYKPPLLNNTSNNSFIAVVGSTATSRPPLPTTKPPIRQASLIPKKMQNLDSSVVHKFLQAVNEQKPPQNGTTNGHTFRSEPIILSSTPQKSHLWKQPENTVTESPVVLRTKSATDKTNSSTSPTKHTPHWMNRTLKTNDMTDKNSPPWVNKPPNVPKPTWNAKNLEKPNATWTPTTSESSHVSNGTSAKPATETNNEVSSSTVNNLNNNNLSAVNGTSPSMTLTNRISIGVTDWRSKYEDAERKRKELLCETQKAAREKATLERRLQKLESDYHHLECTHKEKTQQLEKLSNVSEKVYQDYDQLNNKYEVETSALHRALGAASKWYMENKKLRRESISRNANAPSPLDETDGDDHELDELRKTVQDLSKQVGQLQSELNRAKLQEFEAQEQYANLTQLLDVERQKTQKQTKELKELRLMREKFESVTVMVQGEVESLRQQKEKALEEVRRLQGESHEARKERNVLAHQSSLLMGDITPDDRLFNVLMEVEDLKRKLEEAEHKHVMELQIMQERLEEGISDSHMEILEEKLKLAESELQVALERAEQAEQSLKDMKSHEHPMEDRRSSNTSCAPPPPPPPPMPPMLGGCNPPIRRPTLPIHRPTEGDSLDDMARLLGIQRDPKPPSPQTGAIDNLINEIKGGKFTLKKVQMQKKEEPPAAVQEMMSIIGTLKRRPRQSRPVNV